MGPKPSWEWALGARWASLPIIGEIRLEKIRKYVCGHLVK